MKHYAPVIFTLAALCYLLIRNKSKTKNLGLYLWGVALIVIFTAIHAYNLGVLADKLEYKSLAELENASVLESGTLVYAESTKDRFGVMLHFQTADGEKFQMRGNLHYPGAKTSIGDLQLSGLKVRAYVFDKNYLVSVYPENGSLLFSRFPVNTGESRFLAGVIVGFLLMGLGFIFKGRKDV